jgi:hypothetical protein
MLSDKLKIIELDVSYDELWKRIKESDKNEQP